MRKTAAPLARKYSVCSVTQKTKKVKLEVTFDSGAEESLWPISLLKEIPTLKIVGKKKRFVAANDQDNGHYGRKEVKSGDAGDAKISSSFEVTHVTKSLVAVRRIIEKGNEGAENFRAENCDRRQDSKCRKKRSGPT